MSDVVALATQMSLKQQIKLIKAIIDNKLR